MVENLGFEWTKIAQKHRLEEHELPPWQEYQKVLKSNSVDVLQLPSGCAALGLKFLALLDDDLAATLRHFRHEMDGVPFTSPSPQKMRAWLHKAGNAKTATFGLGAGFRKRFMVAELDGILTYYEKDPATAPNPMDVKPKGTIDLV